MKKTRFPLESIGYTFRGRLVGVEVYDWRVASPIFVYTRQNALFKNTFKSMSYNSLEIKGLWSIL